MSEYKRLTVESEVFDGFTLKDLNESCGEMGCGEYCDIIPGGDCTICRIQEAFTLLAQYESIGSPEEFASLAKAKAEIKLSKFERNLLLINLEKLAKGKVSACYSCKKSCLLPSSATHIMRYCADWEWRGKEREPELMDLPCKSDITCCGESALKEEQT